MCVGGELSDESRTGCQRPDHRIQSDCAKSQYLDDEPENKSEWRCLPCPRGDCTRFSKIYAKALPGYWNVTWRSRSNLSLLSAPSRNHAGKKGAQKLLQVFCVQFAG